MSSAAGFFDQERLTVRSNVKIGTPLISSGPIQLAQFWTWPVAFLQIARNCAWLNSHRLRAIGHLHEAEDESQQWPDLHTAMP
jgi:hypothetical protein